MTPFYTSSCRSGRQIIAAVLLAFFFICCVSPTALRAANCGTIVWGGGTGDWDEPSNWVGGNIPLACHSVSIPGGSLVGVPEGYTAVANNIVNLGEMRVKGILNIDASNDAYRGIVNSSGGLIQNTGSINISNILSAGGSEHGILNTVNSTIINAGEILIQNVAGGGGTGLNNEANATFENNGNLLITNISGTFCEGMRNAGTFTNTGDLSIDGVADIYGLNNSQSTSGMAIFTNTSSGNISITNISSSIGLRAGGIFDNAGGIEVSNCAGYSMNIRGLSGNFDNQPSGTILLETAGSGAILNSAAFLNRGMLMISGSYNSGEAILNTSSNAVFTNESTITIGGATPIGLTNEDLSTFTQTASAELTVNTSPTAINNEGIWQGEGEISGNQHQSSGEISPGASPGTIQLVGDVELDNSNTYTFEMLGVGSSSRDLIEVDGDLVLDGTLVVSISGFSPAANSAYLLMSYTGSVSGTFSSVNLPASAAGFTVIYDQPFGIWLAGPSSSLLAPGCGINQWNGGTGNWNDASSWSNGYIPFDCERVRIPAGTSLTVPTGYTAVAINVENLGTLTIDGTLTVDVQDENYNGLLNLGQVKTNGTLDILNVVGTASGIINEANAGYINNGTTTISQVSGFNGDGIHNKENAAFTNDGTLIIDGISASQPVYGIHNEGNFFNQDYVLITNIGAGTDKAALYNTSTGNWNGNTSGSLTISGLAADYGIYNEGLFRNRQNTGILSTATTVAAVFNNGASATFINEDDLGVSGPTNIGLHNTNSATFRLATSSSETTNLSNIGSTQVLNEANLEGIGKLTAAVYSEEGEVSPGNSPGTISLTGGMLMNNGSYRYEIDNTGTDLIEVSGNLVIDGDLVVSVSGVSPASTDSYLLFTYDGATSGNFGYVDLPASLSGFTVVYDEPGEIWLAGPMSLLPVTWSSFSVRPTAGKESLLRWSTSSESNNKGFQVEHSTDGLQFENIGWVAALNKADGGDYTFTHSTPALGINYYRLQQVDHDGAWSHSSIEQLTFSGHEDYLVYPNPVSKGQGVWVKGLDDSSTVIRLYRIDGQLLWQSAGGDPAQLQQVPTQQLAAGSYILQVGAGTRQLIVVE